MLLKVSNKKTCLPTAPDGGRAGRLGQNSPYGLKEPFGFAQDKLRDRRIYL